MFSKRKYALLGIGLCAVAILSACSAGPTKRYQDGPWKVSENICSSDPKTPELNDMRSVIKQRESYGMSYEREMSFFHLDRRIVNINQKFTRGGSSSGEVIAYENSDSNGVVGSKPISHTRELNAETEASLQQFFSGDPKIDWQDAESFCLYRGQ